MDEGQHVVAVAALIFRGHRVLAMRRSEGRAGAGLWETISGRIQHGEDPLAAMTREIGEECGLEVELEARPFDSYAAKRAGEPMIVIVYRARYVGGEVKRSEEHDAHEWLTPAELAERSTLTRLVQSVARGAREAFGE